MATTKKLWRRSTLGTIIEHRNHFKARYTRGGQWHTPGRTFTTFALADGWLADEQRLIDRDEWTPPADRRAVAKAEHAAATLTFGAYREQWIKERQVRGRALKESTAASYRNIRARQLEPFLAVPLVTITRTDVVAWYRQLDAATPTRRAHAYALFRALMNSAVDEGLIPDNPVRVTGADAQTRKPEVELFTAEQIGQLADLMLPRTARPCCSRRGAASGSGSWRRCAVATWTCPRRSPRCCTCDAAWSRWRAGTF